MFRLVYRLEAQAFVVLRFMLDASRQMLLYLLVANRQLVDERDQRAGSTSLASTAPLGAVPMQSKTKAKIAVTVSASFGRVAVDVSIPQKFSLAGPTTDGRVQIRIGFAHLLRLFIIS